MALYSIFIFSFYPARQGVIRIFYYMGREKTRGSFHRGGTNKELKEVKK
jgi:hypothetical protein